MGVEASALHSLSRKPLESITAGRQAAQLRAAEESPEVRSEPSRVLRQSNWARDSLSFEGVKLP